MLTECWARWSDYGRLFSWLTKGYLIDELGRKIGGGHTYRPQVVEVGCVCECVGGVLVL